MTACVAWLNAFAYYVWRFFFLLFLLLIPYGVFCFLTAPIKARERLVVDSSGFRVVGPCGGWTAEKVNGKKVRWSWEQFREVGTDLKCTKRKDKNGKPYFVRDIDGADVCSCPAIVMRDGDVISIGVYTPKGMTPEQFVANLSMMAQLHANQYQPTEFQHSVDASAQVSADPAATSTLAQGSSASYAPPVVNQEQSTTAATPQSLAAFLAEQNLSEYEAALRE